MNDEAKETIKEFSFEKVEEGEFLPYELFRSQVCGQTINLATLGQDKKFGVDSVGTVPAALTAFDLINKIRPDLIINPGTAGGFKSRGGKIGDIYLPTKVLFHHRDIPMGKFEAYGLGNYEVFNHQKLKKSLEFKTGVFSTSDSLTSNEKDQIFFEENEVVIKEMEAASICYVCEMAKIPYLGVKSVTDIVDGGRVTSEEFLENLETASKNLQVFLKKLINILLKN